MTKKILSIIGVTGALGFGAFALNAVGPASAGPTGVATQAASTASTQGHGECYQRPKDILDELVDKGTITQDQEDAIVQAFKDARAEQGPWGRRGRALEAAVKVVADTIGVTVDELKTAHQNGQSIADVANAHNVDPATVVQAIVDAGNAKIDAAVANGKLTSEQGQALKTRLPKVADRIVNHTKPDC